MADYERCLGDGYAVGAIRAVMQTGKWHHRYNVNDGGQQGILMRRGDVDTIWEAQRIVDEGLAGSGWAIVLDPIGPDGLPWW